MTIEIIQANITTLQVDAIVNAANSSLLGGGGVDGAIHRAAGPELVHACRLLGGCDTGQAKITDGYRLPAAYVIHTVGPVWRGGIHSEAALLASCYSNSLRVAAEKSLTSIAFPCISTGIYGYPPEQAVKIAMHTVQAFMQSPESLRKVIFCCFSDADFRLYQTCLHSDQ
jgi:O-acetyl-ADP-ribose deacetylase